MFSWDFASLTISRCIPLAPTFFLVRTTPVVTSGLRSLHRLNCSIIGFHDLGACYLFQVRLSLCQSTHYHPAPPSMLPSSSQVPHSQDLQGHVYVGSDPPSETCYSSVAPSLSQKGPYLLTTAILL